MFFYGHSTLLLVLGILSLLAAVGLGPLWPICSEKAEEYKLLMKSSVYKAQAAGCCSPPWFLCLRSECCSTCFGRACRLWHRGLSVECLVLLGSSSAVLSGIVLFASISRNAQHESTRKRQERGLIGEGSQDGLFDELPDFGK